VEETDRLKGLLNQKEGAGVAQNLHVILEGHRLNPAWCTQVGIKDLKILLLSIGD
jgi:hypothetical protein